MSSFAQSADLITQTVVYLGPKNDLASNGHLLTTARVSPKLRQGPQEISFPLTFAVECDSEKKGCKYAVVKTALEFKAELLPDKSVAVTGVLRSAIGASMFGVVKDSNALSSEGTLSIPNDAPLIAESSNDKAFEAILRFHEKLELEGLAGAMVTLKFHPRLQ